MNKIPAVILAFSIWVADDGCLVLKRPARLERRTVQLEWSPSPSGNVKEYEIYRATCVGRTTNTVFSDSIVTTGSFVYTVRAVGENGKKSGWSNHFEMLVEKGGDPNGEKEGEDNDQETAQEVGGF